MDADFICFDSGLTSIQAAHAVGNREIVDTLKEHGADLHYGESCDHRKADSCT